jgi:hypothetical protein
VRVCAAQVETFALWTAALAHDAAHDGVNTGFHVGVGSEIAFLYNDRSPLENMHARTCFEVMKGAGCDLMQGFSVEDRRQARKLIIDAIIATDMCFHSDHMSCLIEHQSSALDLQDDSARKMLLELVMHGCDIASTAYPWEQGHRWARLVCVEFQAQVEREQARQLPVSTFMDLRHGECVCSHCHS